MAEVEAPLETLISLSSCVISLALLDQQSQERVRMASCYYETMHAVSTATVSARRAVPNCGNPDKVEVASSLCAASSKQTTVASDLLLVLFKSREWFCCHSRAPPAITELNPRVGAFLHLLASVLVVLG